MYCRVKPYEGDQPYVFVSYCHRDAPQVYPMIEQMASTGYRVWYDDGIHPGANWTEVIAERIYKSVVCIAIVSEASVCSHNCRNELNYMIEHGMNLLPIILSDFPMSLGVKLQLSASQYIRKYEYSDDRVFYEKLFSAEALLPCRGEASLLDESHGSEQERYAKEAAEEDALRQLERVKALLRGPVEPDRDVIADEPTASEEQTVMMGKRMRSPKKEPPTAVLIGIADGTVYTIQGKTTKIGRDDVQDIVIPKKTIGRLHAEILCNSQGFYIRDDDSLNGTTLNGRQLDGLQPVPLGQAAAISFAEEDFLFLAGSDAREVLETRTCAYLLCKETEETRCLTGQDFILGRSNAWSGGAFQNKHASRIHGRISCKDGKRALIVSEKETPNGTFLNGRLLSPGCTETLRPGDVIGIGHVYHIVYHEIALRRT